MDSKIFIFIRNVIIKEKLLLSFLQMIRYLEDTMLLSELLKINGFKILKDFYLGNNLI